MGNSQLREFDASLPILLNDITSDVGITLTTFDDYAIMAARSDDVFPYFGRAELRFIGSSNFYTIFMTSFNLIFNYVWLIIVNLDANLIQIESVPYNLRKRYQLLDIA